MSRTAGRASSAAARVWQCWVTAVTWVRRLRAAARPVWKGFWPRAPGVRVFLQRFSGGGATGSLDGLVPRIRAKRGSTHRSRDNQNRPPPPFPYATSKAVNHCKWINTQKSMIKGGD